MLRSSGARVLDWFCMRGRSVDERAIGIPAAGTLIGRPHPHHDIMPIVNGYKAAVFPLHAKTARKITGPRKALSKGMRPAPIIPPLPVAPPAGSALPGP